MKTEREILSLGPCRCLFYRNLNEREQKIQKLNEIQKYLNVEKRKKDIGRNLKNYKEKIKKYIGRRGIGSPGQSTL